MSSQRFEGRNLDDALEQAAQALGVSRHALTYHVVLEKRGFLGGIKRMVIEADVNPAASEDQSPSQRPADGEIPAEAPAPRRRDGKKREGRGRLATPREKGPKAQGPREARMHDRRPDLRLPPELRMSGQPDSGLAPEQIPEQGSESDQAREVREWCEKLFSLADLALVVRSGEQGETITIQLYGADRQKLLDRDGELLDSLQTLVNKALISRQTGKRIDVDCAHFRGDRSMAIEKRARAIADEVRTQGAEQILPAMNPMERRIVHVALQDDAEVATESRGEGFYKRVAIVPRRSLVSPES